MKMLHVPVPETVTAGYLIPLKTRLTVAEARRRVIAAVGTQVTGPLQTLLLNWIRKGAVILQVTAAPDELLLRDEPSSVKTEQLTRLTGAPTFVRVTGHRRSVRGRDHLSEVIPGSIESTSLNTRPAPKRSTSRSNSQPAG
jgi:hypothetical protein